MLDPQLLQACCGKIAARNSFGSPRSCSKALDRGVQVLLNRYGDVRVRPDMFQVSLGQGKASGPLKRILPVTVLPSPSWLCSGARP